MKNIVWHIQICWLRQRINEKAQSVDNNRGIKLMSMRRIANEFRCEYGNREGIKVNMANKKKKKARKAAKGAAWRHRIR